MMGTARGGKIAACRNLEHAERYFENKGAKGLVGAPMMEDD